MGPRLLACAALLLAACGDAGRLAASPAPAPSSVARDTPIPTQVFDDMMVGGIPAATVFVVSGHEVLAVALLNHFVRFRVPVGDQPQLAVSPDGSRLYVADVVDGDLRLRWLEVGSGGERASSREKIEPSLGGPARTAIGRGALAFGRGGQLLVLRDPAGAGVVVQAYDDVTLRSLGGVFKKQGCADRLLAGPSRLAIACLGNRSEFWIDQEHGPLPLEGSVDDGLAAAAMLSDGTILGVYPSGRLKRLRPGTRDEETLRSTVLGRVVRDGLAADLERIVIAQGGEEPRVQVLGLAVGETRGSFKLPNAPGSGILASGRFAYWVDAEGAGLYHVDLQTGLVEKMFGPLERGAVLAALAPR